MSPELAALIRERWPASEEVAVEALRPVPPKPLEVPQVERSSYGSSLTRFEVLLLVERARVGRHLRGVR